ncbi:leucine-rich repeat flightless-interacting protein 2 isoform X4 [Passer montanus]|nr:leucine-rich repeat flightless-interacting protein 2 isoform X4 [Passer montanus]XP_039571085.1 leucine-rich repeat flightless-interacting protein 2 isoform X4 [Passer montanus]XP_039571086.1 leucine-rich repeat flightless-interacting protein 2 isoform X4 [Passer montanus]XP_039571087.1 leucine-rich repeat flightless-interacting protein 2 isoform X4 [Passer montanus]XP_039571117.1 leucine-rich repeat flightless-interacting protein 2 isoform X4 [Passer montanus]
MGTPGSGRKRTPVKDRFSAEDEALSNIAREAEARLAAKRAARAEARDIRMRELERQQKEFSQHLYDRKWAHIQKWMEDAERARYSHHSSRHSYLSSSDVSASHRSRASTSKRRVFVSGIYYDQRNHSSIGFSKPVPSYHVWSSSLYSDPVAPARSYRPSECGYSSRASSVQSSPVSSDFSDQSETTADYFSRCNHRGSIVSDADYGQVLNSLEEKSEKSHSEIFSRPSSRNSVSAAPQSGNSSRRGSGDASSLVDPDASLSELRDIYDLKDQIHDVEGRYMQGLKELKDSLAEVEEKYKKAMVSNAQLDNEKNNLIYQVDTLKDVIEEKEEQIAEFYRENEEKSKELERQKHTCSVLQHKLDELKEGLRQRDELIEANQRMQENIDFITKEVFDLQETINWKDKKIGALERQKDYFDCIKNERDELREELADLKETMKRGQKHGLVIIPDGTPNGDLNHESVVGTITVVSQEAAQVLESAGEGPLDIRLRKLAGEKEELLSQVRKLKMQLEEERQKYSKSDSMNPDTIDLENGSDLQLIEMQRDANRQISEYKFKLSKAEQDITTLEQNIGRLEGQVARYKNAAENAEKVEDELKAEKRKLQRELRTALDKIEEMEMTNSHLMKRLEKMKANRTALLSQQ